jgi:hypothetical protein
MRDRLMTKDFKLTDRARGWINAIRSQYRSEAPTDQPAIAASIQESAGFKIM